MKLKNKSIKKTTKPFEEILIRQLKHSEADIKVGSVSEHNDVMARIRAKRRIKEVSFTSKQK